MAKAKKQIQINEEREYTVPLRSSWLKVPSYRRAERATRALKQFLAKHLRVEDRDVKKIKLDKYVNEELWFRGMQKPPAKLKVKVKKIKVKDKEFFSVSLVNIPEVVKHRMNRDKKTSETDEKAKKKVEKKEEKIEKISEEKKEEIKEKEETSKENMQQIEKESHKQMKHTSKDKKIVPKRMALQK